MKKIAPIIKSAPKKQPSEEEEEEEHDEPEVSKHIIYLNEMYIRFIITFILLSLADF